MIFRIGKRRLAFDFFTRVTELPPTTGDHPAPVLPMTKNREQNRTSPAKGARISKEGA
jgi:hypothetical protein